MLLNCLVITAQTNYVGIFNCKATKKFFIWACESKFQKSDQQIQ